MAVTFINLFEVPAGRDEEFWDAWTRINTYMRAKPGYLGHDLHRTVLPDARYRFVNVVRWESRQDWAAAHDEGFRELATHPFLAEYPPSPALYEVVHSAVGAA
jgi:heme-degrading monooxygenase HmoA